MVWCVPGALFLKTMRRPWEKGQATNTLMLGQGPAKAGYRTGKQWPLRVEYAPSVLFKVQGESASWNTGRTIPYPRVPGQPGRPTRPADHV